MNPLPWKPRNQLFAEDQKGSAQKPGPGLAHRSHRRGPVPRTNRNAHPVGGPSVVQNWQATDKYPLSKTKEGRQLSSGGLVCPRAYRVLRDCKKIFLPETFSGTSPSPTLCRAMELQRRTGGGPCPEELTGRKIGTEQCRESHGGDRGNAHSQPSVPRGGD